MLKKKYQQQHNLLETLDITVIKGWELAELSCVLPKARIGNVNWALVPSAKPLNGVIITTDFGSKQH